MLKTFFLSPPFFYEFEKKRVLRIFLVFACFTPKFVERFSYRSQEQLPPSPPCFARATTLVLPNKIVNV